MKTGIRNTTEIIALAAALGIAVRNAQSDGKVNASDIGELIAVVPRIAPAIEGADEIPAELRDLDPAEAEQLKQQVVTAVGSISDAKAARLAGRALTIGTELWHFVRELKEDGEGPPSDSDAAEALTEAA